MTDKVQKIREEVQKIARSINPYIPDEDGKNSEYEAGRFAMVTKIMQIIDSMQEEPVSENLEDAAKHYLYSNILYDDVYVGNPTDKDCIEMFKAGAQWQKEQDQSTIELAEDHAMLAGMEKMKEEMMEKATDVTVHIDAGNYPYIPQMELYDYDKDIPLAKEGDKYKIILIKED